MQKNSEAQIVNVAEVNHPCCFEESGQWLENVDQTHLVLASGKLVLQTRNAGRVCPALLFRYDVNFSLEASHRL